MANTALLGIPQVSSTQNNKHTTINNALAYLEQAANAIYVNAAAGGSTINMTVNQLTRYGVFKFSGLSANIAVTFPNEISTGVDSERVFIVHNADATYTLTIQSTGAGADVDVPPGSIAALYLYADDVFAVGDVAAGGTDPYDFGFFVPGVPGDGATVLIHKVTRDVTLADDFAGSVGYCGTNPASSAVFNINKNGGGTLGTITIATGGGFTFNTTGGSVSLVAGDRLEVIAPSPQDVNLADVAVTFQGTR